MDDPASAWIQTHSGRKFWPLDPRPGDVDVGDVAHALANVCRFAGHTKTFYSVGQHCCLAAGLARPEHALYALLHDAAEAYLGDIPRPWKRFLYADHSMGRLSVKDLERRLLDAILDGLNVPRPSAEALEAVADIDLRLLAAEKRDLMTAGLQWLHEYEAPPGAEPVDRVIPWTPEAAERTFLTLFDELTNP